MIRTRSKPWQRQFIESGNAPRFVNLAVRRNRRARRRFASVIAGLVLVSGLARGQSARGLVKQGNEAYQNERYEEALNAYAKAAEVEPDSPHIWFNRGSALYRKGEYGKAIDAFEQAALRSGDPSFEALSKFSQGNAAFRQGLEQQQADPRQALTSVEKGARLYQDALKLDPGLNDARHNIEVARLTMQKLLEQLKNQPPGAPSKKGDPQQKQSEEQSQDQQSENDVAQKLQDLIEKQKEAAEKSEAASERQQREGDSQQMRQQAEELAKQQQNLKNETGKLADQMKSQPQQGQQTSQEEVQEHVERAAQEQAEAEKQLRNREFDQAQATQQEAQKDLQNALQAMGGRKEGESQQQPQQARQSQPVGRPAQEQGQEIQETVQDILDKERSDRRERQVGLAIRIVPVEKDW